MVTSTDCIEMTDDNCLDFEMKKKEILYSAWRLVDTNYAFFKFKDIDWWSVWSKYEKCIKQISTYKSLYQIIENMLYELEDAHTKLVYSPYIARQGIIPLTLKYLNNDFYVIKKPGNGLPSEALKLLQINDISMKEIENKFSDKIKYKENSAKINAIMSKILNGEIGYDLSLRMRSMTGEIIEENIKYQSLANIKNFDFSLSNLKKSLHFCETRNFGKEIGYIKIHSFQMKNVVAEFEKLILCMDNKHSLIIDIRGNDGGSVENAIKTVGLLLNKSLLLGYKIKRDGTVNHYGYKAPEPIIIRPSKVNVMFNKIFVLCDEFTMSSAEFIFLNALKKSECNTIVIGQKTAGLINIASIYTLFDDTKLQISTAILTDESGKILKNKGIIPDVEVVNTDKIFYGEDKQLEYALNQC
ncbi:hypothetical protein K040078D81_44050 [Blautia hominis]|uniref:Tail specific protease domain-containing protein n=1 Tax=Blautia hominis TaxID=2025493 RepID=A0ABQ0BG11_9FIRM